MKTFVLLTLILMLSTSPAAALQPISTCGEIATSNAVLAADLDCTGLPVGVTLDEGRTLKLAGFTITGATTAGVVCNGKCKILGPGVLDANEVGVVGAANLKLTDATISNSNGVGIDVAASGLKPAEALIRNSVIEGSGSDGLSIEGNVRMFDSTVAGNAGAGVFNRFYDSRVRVRDCQINDNGGHGITFVVAGKLSIKDSSLLRNGESGANLIPSTISSSAKIVGSVLSDNGTDGCTGDVDRIKNSNFGGNGGTGATVSFGRVKNSTFQNNGVFGLSAHVSTVKSSTMTGNGTDPDCDVSFVCGDLAVGAGAVEAGYVKLKDVTCETSVDRESCCPGVSVGVCSLD